jgi:hypothetical protein
VRSDGVGIQADGAGNTAQAGTIASNYGIKSMENQRYIFV